MSGVPELGQYPKPAIQFLIITAGNYWMANSPCVDMELKRFGTYGRPGRYRPQHYPNGEHGVEFRSMSNSWASWDVAKIEELTFWSDFAVKCLVDRKVNLLDEFLTPSVNAILAGDQIRCQEILNALQ